MWRPCAINDFSTHATKSGVSALAAANRCKAHNQAMTRKDNSRLLAQLMPRLGGLDSSQEVMSVTNCSAYFSSLVSQYAWPKVMKNWQRLSSQVNFLSPATAGFRKSI